MKFFFNLVLISQLVSATYAYSSSRDDWNDDRDRLRYGIADFAVNPELPDFEHEDKNNNTPRSYNSSAPRWRVLNRGLNFQGKCENKSCEAYKQKVDAKVGLGTHRVIRNSSWGIEPPQCPICHSPIASALAIIFSSCHYKIRGLKKSGWRGDSGWKTIRNKYIVMSPDEMGATLYKQLEIECLDQSTTPPQESDDF